MEEKLVTERIIHIDIGKKKETNWKKYFIQVDLLNRKMLIYSDETKKELKKTITLENCEFYDAVKTKQEPCVIKLKYLKDEKSKKKLSYYIKGQNIKELDELKIELEDIGGCFMGFDVEEKGFSCSRIFSSFGESRSEVEKLEERRPEKWSKDDCLVWLEEVNLSSLKTTFKENDIDGSILVELDQNTIQTLNVDEKTSKKLESEINFLMRNKRFNKSYMVVKNKMEKIEGEPVLDGDLQILCESLCDVAQLKHKLLNSADLKNHLVKFEEKDKKELDDAKMPDMHTIDKLKASEVKVKIVVTEMLQSNKMKKLRKIISPIVNSVLPNFSQNFGFFHTAVIVGPWYLEWTDSELVVPKRMVSGGAILASDTESLYIPKDEINLVSDKIAEVIVKWNTKMKYINTHSNNPNEGNCQLFVEEVLQSIGIKPQFDGSLGKFLDDMRKKGKCNFQIHFDGEFQSYFGVEEQSVEFETHKQLDEFVIKLKEQCIDLQDTFKSEYSLLKSFDRAFWLRHLKFKDDEKYKPMEPKEKSIEIFCTGCPFDDPRRTLSLV